MSYSIQPLSISNSSGSRGFSWSSLVGKVAIMVGIIALGFLTWKASKETGLEKNCFTKPDKKKCLESVGGTVKTVLTQAIPLASECYMGGPPACLDASLRSINAQITNNRVSNTAYSRPLSRRQIELMNTR